MDGIFIIKEILEEMNRFLKVWHDINYFTLLGTYFSRMKNWDVLSPRLKVHSLPQSASLYGEDTTL